MDAVRADCFERLNAFIAARIQSAGGAAEMLLAGGMAYIEYAGQQPQAYHLMFNVEPSRATSGAQRALAMRTLLQIVQAGAASGQAGDAGPGDEGHCLPRKGAAALNGAFPQAAVTRYAGAGHYVQDAKGPKLAALIAQFMAHS